VPPRHDGERANAFENHQNATFQNNQPNANPDPTVNFVIPNSVAQVKNDRIEKQPNGGVDEFDDVEFGHFLKSIRAFGSKATKISTTAPPPSAPSPRNADKPSKMLRVDFD